MRRSWGGPSLGVRMEACVRSNDTSRYLRRPCQTPCFVSSGRRFSAVMIPVGCSARSHVRRRPSPSRCCFSDGATTGGEGPSAFRPAVLEHQVSVTCLPGLEPILSQEIRALGLQLSPHDEDREQHQQEQQRKRKREKQQPQRQGQEQQQQQKSTTSHRRGEVVLAASATTAADLLRACLYLGTATNLRVRCGPTFTARGLPELRRKIALLAWPDILQDPVDAKLRLGVRATSSKSKLYHTAAIRERVLLGVFDSFGHSSDAPAADDFAEAILTMQDGKSQTISPGPDGPTVQLEVLLWKDQVDVFVNASPIPLHQRGYRLQTAKAPLREDLAYAMLLSAGWVPSWLRSGATVPDEPGWTGLLDPFCGSGTIAIEGAAMAMGLPPGRLRAHEFFRGTVWNDGVVRGGTYGVRASNGQDDKPGANTTTVRVAASDRDAGAVQATRNNAERAGVLEMIDIQEAPLSSQPWLDGSQSTPTSLLVVTNPPFGKRVSPSSQLSSSLRGKGGRDQSRTSGDVPSHLLPLYQTLGHRLKKFAEIPGHRASAVVLMDDPSLAYRLGLSLSVETLFQSTHGGLPISAMRLGVPLPIPSTKS